MKLMYKNYCIESSDGYIVFEDGGASLLSYGASEEWFRTYNEAINYAMKIINKRTEELKHHIDFNSVIIYEGPKELLHTTHSIPPSGRKVVFEWRNYHKYKE